MLFAENTVSRSPQNAQQAARKRMKPICLLLFCVSVSALGCAPLAEPPPEALPPAPTERLAKLHGTPADPIFHRSMYAGEQAYNGGYYARAERYYAIGLKRARQIGLPDFHVAWAAAYLFDVCVAQGKYGEAEQLFRESLPVIERANPKRTEYLSRYAALLRRLGREAEAAEMETRAKVRAVQDKDKTSKLTARSSAINRALPAIFCDTGEQPGFRVARWW